MKDVRSIFQRGRQAVAESEPAGPGGSGFGGSWDVCFDGIVLLRHQKGGRSELGSATRIGGTR